MFNAFFSRSSKRDRADLFRFIETEYGNEVRTLTRNGLSHESAVTGIARRMNYVR